MNRIKVILAGISLLLFCSSAQPSSNNDIQALKSELAEVLRQVQQLQQRIDELEATQIEQVPSTNKQPSSKTSLASSSATPQTKEALKLKADLRYRYDNIDDQAAETERSRNRLRARAEIIATVSNDIQLGFGIASGDEDPISTNQTLGNAASSKDWRMDLAYFDWQLTDSLSWLGGKHKNQVYRPGGHFLIWDGDLRPEGLTLVNANDHFFGSLAYNILESDNRAGEQDTAEYFVAQLGTDLSYGETRFTLGSGYYFFDVKDKGNFDTTNAFGNSLTPDGTYRFAYKELEFFAELETLIFDLPFSAFFDYVVNLDADEEDTGYALGFNYGSTKEKGGWRFGYTYQDLEADAVFGAFADSDFAGGGTDAKGHVFSGGYAINQHVELGISFYDNQYGQFSLGEAFDYQRTFIDLLFKY